MKKNVTPEDRKGVERLVEEAVATVHLLQHRKAVAEAAMATGEALFQGCHDLSGRPLDVQSRVAITAFLDSPSEDTWRVAQRIVVNGSTNLAKEWRRFDSHAPRPGESGFPTSKVLWLVIRASVEENLAEVTARLADIACQ
jgi:hypothetical protein